MSNVQKSHYICSSHVTYEGVMSYMKEYIRRGYVKCAKVTVYLQ